VSLSDEFSNQWQGPVMYPRNFARVRPTGRSSKAKIIVGPKAPRGDCNVIDYSPGGACLEVRFRRPKCPIDLNCCLASRRSAGRVVWTHGRDVLGVVF